MMKKSKYAYCESCDKDVRFNIIEQQIESEFRGVKYTFLYKKAVCKHCGEHVYPVSVGKENELSERDAYKKAAGLLTSKEIIAIRKKLGLTQEGLADLIGCGAKNIARYESGLFQIRAIDNAIRALANEEPNEVNKALGEELKKARSEKHITLKELSKETNVSENAISNFEKGIDPSLMRLNDLFKALDKHILITVVPNQKKSKRIGSAKKEMGEFDLKLDEFNSIPFEGFKN